MVVFLHHVLPSLTPKSIKLWCRSPLTCYLLLDKFTSAYITTVLTAAAKDKANKDATAANIETLMALPECQISQRTKKASMYTLYLPSARIMSSFHPFEDYIKK